MYELLDSFIAWTAWEMKDLRAATWTFAALCGVAFAINLIFWNVSGGSINMFFVGQRNSSPAVFKDIAGRFGWYASTALYIPTVCLGAAVLSAVSLLLEKTKYKTITRKRGEWSA